MVPRDEAELRRQQIIDSALRTFSRLGFERTTNRNIARAAGIRSPRLIYRYFKDKTDLLYQVVRERMSLIQFIDSMKELDDTPPKAVLPQLAGRLAHPIADRCDGEDYYRRGATPSPACSCDQRYRARAGDELAGSLP